MTVWFNVEYGDADQWKISVKLGGHVFELPYQVSEDELLRIIKKVSEDDDEEPEKE